MVEHSVIVRAPKALVNDLAPLLLERTDARFMDAVRLELGDGQKREALLETRVQRQDGALRLCQPVHRAFNLAVVEVVCDVPGQPRLDPRKIDGAGLVVRRVIEPEERGPDASLGRLARITPREQAWMRRGDALAGWVDVSAPADEDDPDPTRRPRRGAHPVLAERLARHPSAPAALAEDVSALFVLPPETCESAKSTLLYGLVPTASLDRTPAEPAAVFDAADVLADLPDYLKSRETLASESKGAPGVPSAGRRLERPRGAVTEAALLAYSEFVERATAEYDLFGDTPGADRLREALGAIEVELGEDDRQTLLEHLRSAADVLVFGPPAPTPQQPEPPDAGVRMPVRWPDIAPEVESLIVAAVGDILRRQFERMQSHEGRFDRPGARYSVRAFVRVRREDGCPPRIYWSASSEPFFIAPWFEPARGPLPVVQLPDPFKEMAKFKPNVVFSLPPSISDIVHKNTAAKLLEGEGKRGTGLGLGWLCGFNIPLITLCAFIVLSIFLSLFQIIFWWLAFIRICIPIPVPKRTAP